jgi:hypothetical protein
MGLQERLHNEAHKGILRPSGQALLRDASQAMSKPLSYQGMQNAGRLIRPAFRFALVRV